MPLAALALLCAGLPLAAQPNVLTWKYNNTRLGVNSTETTLTTANVNSSSFGLLFHIYPNEGKPDPQPLYVANLAIPGKGTRNVLFIETEKDYAFAYDADTGQQLWKVSVLLPGESPSDARGVGSVTPVIGVTSTPVIDLAMGPHGTEYLIAMSIDASSNYHHRLHALDITTGAEQFNGPVEIAATYPGTGP
jgi:outer membrane protein assembly factor BamB